MAISIPSTGLCPYCYSRVIEHCTHNPDCDWYECVICKAFGPQNNFVEKVREEIERAQ